MEVRSMCDDTSAIEFVQGDSVDRIFLLQDEAGEAVDPTTIAAVYFTCRAAKFQQQLFYDETQQAYLLTMTYDDTRVMPKGRWTYDLTVEFVDTKRRTATYNGTFNILPKINCVAYEGG